MKKSQPSTLLRNIELEGIPDAVRRRLNTIQMDTPDVRMLTDALDKLKVEYESPGFRGDAVAHVVIPEVEVAIFLPYQGISKKRLARVVDGWKTEGWLGAYYLYGQVETLASRGSLQDDLAAAIEVRKAAMKKRKK